MRQGAKGTQTALGCAAAEAASRAFRRAHRLSRFGKHDRLAGVGFIHQAREVGLGLVHVDQPMLGRIQIPIYSW